MKTWLPASWSAAVERSTRSARTRPTHIPPGVQTTLFARIRPAVLVAVALAIAPLGSVPAAASSVSAPGVGGGAVSPQVPVVSGKTIKITGGNFGTSVTVVQNGTTLASSSYKLAGSTITIKPSEAAGSGAIKVYDAAGVQANDLVRFPGTSVW